MENKTMIQIYSQTDIKKSGGFKKKNNVMMMTKEEFFIYLKENNLTINSQYIDIVGEISNDKRFKCYLKNGMIFGTSGIVKEFREQ